MCGIVGYQGNFSEALLRAMTAAVAHRGPDGEGMTVLSEPGRLPTGLGHRRLAIIDLSAAGCQPMTVVPDPPGDMQTGLTLIFNGEIYNYRELRAELTAAGHRFTSATDSEVLLHLYEQVGFKMLGRLNGIFAFAIHDARPRGRPPGVPRGALFLARDQLGVKPLYYAQTPCGLLFASELKALLCEPSLSRQLDPVALHYTLAYLWTPAPHTLLTAVRKLEPGHALLIHEGAIKDHWRYYQLPYGAATSELDFDAGARALARHLEQAVQRQLMSDVPVGAYLSGGLDSSAVVAMMRRAQPERHFTCFTVDFPEGADTEGAPADLPYARKVARHLNVDLVEVPVRPADIERLPQMVELLDEPQADPAPINALLIAEHARAMGIPVLLSGAGGDDIFSGYRRHWALGFERVWAWLPGVARRSMQNTLGASGIGQTRPGLRRLAKMFAYAGEDGDRRLISYFWWSDERLRRGLYTADFAAQLADTDTAAPLLRSLAQIPAERDPLQRMLYLETKHFLADHNLNYTDRAGMAAGVEVRVPLLDIDLVHFAAGLPAAYKQRGRTGKAVFKRAMEPYLPREVVYRRKTGFGAPLRRWLRHELRPLVDDTLSVQAVRKRGIFDPGAVQGLVERDRSGAIDAAYTIFALMTLELWCRRFL